MGWMLCGACALCFSSVLLLAPRALEGIERARRNDRSRQRIRRGRLGERAQPERLSGPASAFVSLAMLMGRGPLVGRPARKGSHGRLRQDDVLDLRVAEQFVQSGLSDFVTQREVAALMRRLPVAAGALAALCLLPMGALGAFVGLALGTVLGWWWPRRTLARLSQDRRQACERDMPSMLDIVGMGIRAGLSFDMALRVFSQR